MDHEVEADINTDFDIGGGGGLTLPPVQTHRTHTFTLISSLKLKTEICDTMCEAHVRAVAASQAHRQSTTRQIHAGGENSLTDNVDSFLSLSKNPAVALSAI